MSDLKKALNFYVLFESDGTNKNFTVSFATDPIAFAPPSTSTLLSPLFASLPSDVPVDSLFCDLGIASASYNALTHVLTGAFTDAGTDDTLHTLGGNALY